MATVAQSSKKSPKAPNVDLYTWKGVNKRGDQVSGEIRAQSVNEAKALLRNQGVIPSGVKKKPKPLLNLGGGITPMDIAIITRQIATMLGAGVPLVQSFEMIGKGHEKEKMRELIASIKNELAAGLPLAECLRQHPRYFDALYCDLIGAGEQSGSLDTIYGRVATYKEKAEALKSKIKKALFYPAAVVVVAIIVTAILLIKVVPTFKEIFEGFGAQLPAFTIMVINMSEFMQEYWWLMLGVVVALGYAYKEALIRSKKVKDRNDLMILKLPIIGGILHKAAVARFARTLSTTFASGVPLISALESAAGASGNAFYRDAILTIRREVETGMQMNIAMRMTNAFPDMVVQMVAIGEESGAVDDMLAKIANVYEQQVDDAVDALTSLLEPLIMVVLGTLVGGLIIAMYLPIFSMGSVV
ncbi:MAG: type II secretion system F family protein [Gammaproteobacteria bacterium]|nr:type II secretion system F family protein [Gammaproteobacteria bacterium]